MPHDTPHLWCASSVYRGGPYVCARNAQSDLIQPLCLLIPVFRLHAKTWLCVIPKLNIKHWFYKAPPSEHSLLGLKATSCVCAFSWNLDKSVYFLKLFNHWFYIVSLLLLFCEGFSHVFCNLGFHDLNTLYIYLAN